MVESGFRAIKAGIRLLTDDNNMASRLTTHPSRNIVIFASELASAVGRHRYLSQKETFRKVWLRSHQQSFCFAHALQFKSDLVCILTECEELTIQFPALKQGVDLVDFASVLRKVICDFSLRSLYRQILSFLKVRLFQSSKEERVLVTARVVDEIAVQVETLVENEIKPVASVVKEICDKAKVEKKEVVEAVESKITKDRGTRLESKAVNDFGKAKGIEIDHPILPELFYREMEHEGVKWSVCGKVDAETEDSIIEVKNRKNRFMCPEYDYIQLQTYLFIRNKPRGILLERLRGENKESCFEFDEELWQELTVELAEFVAELLDAMEISKQALYGCASPRKRIHDKVGERKEGSCQVTDGEPLKKVAYGESGESDTRCTSSNEKLDDKEKID